MVPPVTVGALQELYFDLLYNPLYDSVTARLARYRALQERCLQLLALPATGRLLCAGLGTGNELVRAMRASPRLRATGVDLSPSGLASSRRKLRKAGQTVDLYRMDVASLRFAAGTFDRVLCMHVLDFVPRPRSAVRELIRVLAPQGRFVITLPSRREGAALGAALFREEIITSIRAGRHPLRVVADLLARFAMGLVYVPLLARMDHPSFSRQEARELFRCLPVHSLEIEEERAYQDFVVTGLRD